MTSKEESKKKESMREVLLSKNTMKSRHNCFFDSLIAQARSKNTPDLQRSLEGFTFEFSTLVNKSDRKGHQTLPAYLLNQFETQTCVPRGTEKIFSLLVRKTLTPAPRRIDIRRQVKSNNRCRSAPVIR